MSTWRYFVSEEQLKAKNWDMLQEAKALRSRRAALENEWNKFAASWGMLARAKTDFAIRFDEKNITVLNRSQRMSVVDTVPQAHFDLEAMKRIQSELEKTEAELDTLDKQLRDIGVNLRDTL
jgi:uncharacterized protein YcaQ